VARHVCLGARMAEDEVFELDALRVLAAAAPQEVRPKWKRAQNALVESTGYAKYRGVPPDPDPLVDGLIGAVLEVLAN